MSNFKRIPLKDAVHIEFVRGLPCLDCSAPPRSDPHHVNERMMSSMARTADDDCAIPLCRRCHSEGAHGTLGEETYYESLGGRGRVRRCGKAIHANTGNRDRCLELMREFRNE